MKKIFYTIVSCTLAALSCTKQGTDVTALTDGEIKFEAGISTKATASAFETGDMMSIWAVEQEGEEKMPLQLGGNYINNECLTFDGTKWAASRKLYWSAKPCDFIAVYPYLASVTSVDRQFYSVFLDQDAPASESALSGYEAADVMYARAENVRQSDGSVRLDFYHLLSKCSVNVIKGEKFEGEIPDDIVVHLYNTTTDYSLDLVKGSVSRSAFGAKRTITMHKKDNQHFEAIVVPQNIEISTPLVEVTMGGIAYLLNYSMSFKPAYNHTINLTLNTSPDQEMIDINIDVDQDGWN